MTVFENMAFALKLRGVPRTVIREKVAEAAALLGLGPLLGRKPAALSGGQRQRVAVGRAIVRTPKCFLFDEPLSNLDARLRGEMRVELRQLHQRLRTTSIYVTHDQEEAMTLGDKVAVMKDGVLQQYDTPLSIYEHPANRFVASFVGTPSMGFLPGRLRFGDGRPRFEAAGVDWPLPAAPPPLPDGAPVVLGVRPQAFREAPAGDRADAARLPVVLELVEHLGAQMDLSFTLAGVRLTARVDARAGLRVGAALDLFVDTRKLHLFDAESGHSLDPRHGARRPA
jgi:multiple sugar transport system ATP-binding protein